MYNGTSEAIVGECKLYTTQNVMNHTFEFKVLQGNYTPILSLESCVAMGFLKNLNCDQPECVYYSMKSSTYKATAAWAVTRCLLVLENWKPLTESKFIPTVVHLPRGNTGSHSQRIEGKAWQDGPKLLEQLQDVYWCWKTGNPLQNPSSYRQLYTSQEGISVVIHSALKEKLEKVVLDGVNCTCHRSLRVAFECGGSPQTLRSPPNWHQP